VKIIVFDNDTTILDILKIFLTNHGHEVQVFPEPHVCSFNLLDDNQCPSTTACADAVLINSRNPTPEFVETLTGLIDKGCKLSLGNRAIMSTSMTDEQASRIRDEDLHVIRKPFRLTEVLEWVNRREQLTKVNQPAELPYAPGQSLRSD
jgi:DNA-binding response OmpR family regulator